MFALRRNTGLIVLFFVIAQILGVITGIIVQRDMDSNPFVSGLVITADSNSPGNALFFLGYILFGALLMIVMIRFLKNLSFIFALLEFWLISSSSSIVFYAFLRFLFPVSFSYAQSTLIGILMGLVLAAFKVFLPRLNLKNHAAILSTAGVGVVFGVSLGIYPVLLFLILLSVYDFLAVFMTKHMVEMADFVVKKDLAFTVTAHEIPPSEEHEEGERRMDLGTGDMIAPIMLEISAFSFSPVAALMVFLGANVAMIGFLYMLGKKRVVLPALPPIVFGMLFFLLLGFMLHLYSL